MSTPKPADAIAFQGTIVNDRHSGLNATAVKRVLRPASLIQLSEIIKSAAVRRMKLSVAGGRHAMGGQQFLQNGLLIDMTALDRVLEFDAIQGTVRVEAGATWPRILGQLDELQAAADSFWTFAQKQTGADDLTIGGALAANVHGRGLRMKPIVQDVMSFDLVGADGRLVHCSRVENPHLFRLVIGGYGLFGVVYAVTLQLVRRRTVRRLVEITEVADLMTKFDMGIRNGCVYGDFQFAIDPRSDEFLKRGVFALYEPVTESIDTARGQKSLSPGDWERLLYLAHVDKSRAFREYSEYYRSTHGQLYYSDKHQFSYYPEGYHSRIDQRIGACCASSEMITELFVPRAGLPGFLRSVKIFARRYGWNIIYGTIRLIERDDETFLRWATEPWACVIFNLCVEHSSRGIEQARSAFRNLIQIAINYGGSYYLTYHKWATVDQMLACYPHFPQFVSEKQRYDPQETFVSNWYLAWRGAGR